MAVCEHIRPSCAHAVLRKLTSNLFAGNVEALGKLTKLTYLCVRAGLGDVATLLIASLYKYERLEMSASINIDC